MGRNSVYLVVTCVVGLTLAGCGPRERPAADDAAAPVVGDTGEPPQARASREGTTTGDEQGNDVDPVASLVDPEDHGTGQLPDAEIEARMRRPIEESVYDPSLSKDEKLDLLLRHYSIPGNHVTEPDALMDAVMTEGMTELEAAKYWAVEGGSQKWALHHAEAVLRRDPRSVEALVLWAGELPIARRNERQAAFLAVLEIDPANRQALSNLAGGTAMEQPFESIEYADRLLEAYPDRGAGYAYMGRAYERLGDPDTAASYYEKGLKADPGHRGLLLAVHYLETGTGVQPIAPAQRSDATDAPEMPTPPPVPSTASPGEDPSPRLHAPDATGPAPETPEPVKKHQKALNQYRAMAAEFENVTGEPYRGLQDFDDYAEQSSNWMAWRYMELGQQYLDAGEPDKAAEVFEKAERQFPDDPLIQQRTQPPR